MFRRYLLKGDHCGTAVVVKCVLQTAQVIPVLRLLMFTVEEAVLSSLFWWDCLHLIR